MTKEEIMAIVRKYYNMSEQIRRYGEAKCIFFEQIADNIEDKIFEFEDKEEFETEEDVVEFVKESIHSFENFYDDDDLENMDMLDDLPEYEEDD